jgi:hypothetical protein
MMDQVENRICSDMRFPDDFVLDADRVTQQGGSGVIVVNDGPSSAR